MNGTAGGITALPVEYPISAVDTRRCPDGWPSPASSVLPRGCLGISASRPTTTIRSPRRSKIGDGSRFPEEIGSRPRFSVPEEIGSRPRFNFRKADLTDRKGETVAEV